MAGTTERIRSVCLSLVLRKPFFDALTLCMIMSEREKNARAELLPQTFVYIYIVAMFFAGTMLSFGNQKSLFALLGAGFTAAFSLMSHAVMAPVEPWLKLRMIVRDMAMVGMYLIIASRGVENLEKRRYRLAWMFPYGCGLLAAYLCTTAFQLNQNPQEQGALDMPFHLGDCARIALAGVFVVCGTLLAAEWNTKAVSRILVVALTLYIYS